MIQETTKKVPISVTFPFYNAERYLRGTVKSLLAQTFQDFELIAVNDGSTDNSLKIMREYASKDSRFHIYDNPHIGRVSVVKNFGIGKSTGEYVYPLDADDYLSPDALENMYNRANETGADTVIPDLICFSEEGEGKKLIGLRGNRDVILTNRQAFVESLDWSIHTIALTRGDLIRKLRVEEFGYGEEFSSRIFLFYSNKVAFSHGTYYYRQHSNSATGSINFRTFDRPYALCRLALFLRQNAFEEYSIRDTFYSAFIDCGFLARCIKNLPADERPEAEKKLKNAYDLIDKVAVRKKLNGAKGRKKYEWKLLSYLKWCLLKRFYFFF